MYREYGAISSIMVIRSGYKLPIYTGGRLTVAFTFQEVFSFDLFPKFYACSFLIAVGTLPLEADTSFKVVGCLEYILHNIWELLTDFSALPARTAFWVHIEFKIEQIRRKTLYIKIKDGEPIHQKYKANESTSRHNPKEKKKKRS
jgi:hypothetical protein